jgi:hypothetical protein
MIEIKSMDQFQSLCRKKYKDWWQTQDLIVKPLTGKYPEKTFVTWSCKELKNFKCNISGIPSGVFGEYTYNGETKELYEDIYIKVANKCHTEE